MIELRTRGKLLSTSKARESEFQSGSAFQANVRRYMEQALVAYARQLAGSAELAGYYHPSTKWVGQKWRRKSKFKPMAGKDYSHPLIYTGRLYKNIRARALNQYAVALEVRPAGDLVSWDPSLGDYAVYWGMYRPLGPGGETFVELARNKAIPDVMRYIENESLRHLGLTNPAFQTGLNYPMGGAHEVPGNWRWNPEFGRR